MTQEISKQKAKYLKRAAFQTKRQTEQAARRLNKRTVSVPESAVPAEPNTFRFSYTENDRARIQKTKARQMMPLRAQALMASATLAATPEPHVHTADCGHGTESVPGTEIVLTPEIENP